MRRNIILCIFLLCLGTLNAQLWENFSDGDLVQDPSWLGILSDFHVNNNSELQLNAEGAGESWLSTNNQLADSVEWSFWIRLAFSPSANNNARIYLMADAPVPADVQAGYFLQFGESGSSDAIELFRQSGTVLTSVCRGSDGLVSTSFMMNIRVTLSSNGEWKLFVDPDGFGQFTLEASGVDNQVEETAYFGILCKYTSSNSSKFYFDDFMIRHIQKDTIPPCIIFLQAASPNQLRIEYAEPVTPETALDTTSYFTGYSSGYPGFVVCDTENPLLYHLFFRNSFQDGITHTCAVKNISDLEGNLMNDTVIEFCWYEARTFDIVINEIMADPEPPAELPPMEYIELYNTSEIPIDMTGWTVEFGSYSKTLPATTIQAENYLLLSKGTQLGAYGQVVDLFTSSTSLSNAGTTITLRNRYGHVIHSVSYSEKWYTNPIKEEGGWALEQMDPFNPCGGPFNWKESIDYRGGTPGERNSVYGVNTDTVAPDIYSIAIQGEKEIRVSFNEQMDSLSLAGPPAYSADKGLGFPEKVISEGPDFRSVILGFESPIEAGFSYTLTITDSLCDCAGNPLALNSQKKFAHPAIPGYMDIVINEILFDPYPEGEDFVEIYNRSGNVIDLSGIMLSSMDTLTGFLTEMKAVTDQGYLLFPSEFVVLTRKPEAISQFYITARQDRFIGMASFPVYPNQDGIVVLSRKNDGQILDQFSYSADYHFDLLNSTEGISLERINYDLESDNPANWHSASKNAGWATPGYQNSQYTSFLPVNNPLSVEPQVFSPNNDGRDDLLRILYHMEEPGYAASLTIFDTKGIRIKILENNTLIGTEGVFIWDGTTERHEVARGGIYIINLDIFNLQGVLGNYKKVCVVAE